MGWFFLHQLNKSIIEKYHTFCINSPGDFLLFVKLFGYDLALSYLSRTPIEFQCWVNRATAVLWASYHICIDMHDTPSLMSVFTVFLMFLCLGTYSTYLSRYYFQNLLPFHPAKMKIEKGNPWKMKIWVIVFYKKLSKVVFWKTLRSVANQRRLLCQIRVVKRSYDRYHPLPDIVPKHERKELDTSFPGLSLARL